MQQKNWQNNLFLEIALNHSIKTKLIITVFTIILILGIAMGTYLHTVQTNELTQILQEKGFTITHNLVENSVNPILHNDAIKLQNLVEITKKSDPDVAYAFILDNNGNVLAHTFENGFPISMKDVNPTNELQYFENKNSIEKSKNIKLLEVNGEYISDIAHPVLDGRLGEVHVGISQTDIRGTIQSSKMFFTGFTAISLIIGALMAFAAGTVISRPILLLEKGVRDFGSGNFDHEVNVESRNEIGNLAHAFNDMAGRIKILMQEQKDAGTEIMNVKNYLDVIIENSHEAIFVINSEGNIEFVNKAFLKLSGYEKDEIIGKSFMILITEDNRNFILEKWDEVQRGVGKPYETKAISKDGILMDMMVSHTKVEFSDSTKYVVMARDVTEIKKINEMKNNIISNISHELRTPITIMRGFIEVAMGEKIQSKRNEYLSRAINAIDRQNRMVQDLIETAMSKVAEVKLVFETVDFKDILNTSFEDVIHKANLSGISIKNELEKDLHVKADKQQLEYVLTKLMDNAIKFTGKGGVVEVLAKHTNGFVEICVKDTGIGISKENQGKIFDTFYQVDATTTRKYGGSGVGLAISKNLIEKHGGNIWVESELGEGTTFFFTIPKA